LAQCGALLGVISACNGGSRWMHHPMSNCKALKMGVQNAALPLFDHSARSLLQQTSYDFDQIGK
jgi:hypothetical protein